MRNWIWEVGLLLVLPLAFYRGFAEPFSTPKLFLVKFLIITGLAGWALGQVWKPALRLVCFPMLFPLVAFSLAALASCLSSPVPRFSLLEVEFALCGPAWILLLASRNASAADARRILGLISVAGGVAAGIALVQRLGFDPILLGGYQVDWGSMVGRMHLYSTFGNPNFVGGYLIATIFPAMALAVESKARWAKVMWWVCTLVMLAAIVETGSHGAWVGLAAGLVAVAIMTAHRAGPHLKALWHRASGTGIKMCVAPSAGWALTLLALTLAERVAAQLYGRIYLWSFSWSMFRQHPLLGSGWGTYQLLYLEFQGRYLAAHPEYVGYWTNNRLLHNDPMQLLLEAGLLGFGLFVWVLWEYARVAARVWRLSSSATVRGAIAASVGGVTAILIDSFFNYQFAVPPTYILLATLLAIPAMVSEAETEPRAPEGPVPAQSTPRKSWLRVLKGVGSLAILAAASGLVWEQTRVLLSERAYQAGSDIEDQGNMAGAEKAFHRSVHLNDLNGRSHFGLSRLLYSTGRLPEALEEIARAEQTYTDSHQEVLRGRILDKMGRNEQALAAYRHARWLDPTLTTVDRDIDRLDKAP